MNSPTPARIARERAGLTLAQAAAKARVGEGYLRRCELHGAPLVLAMRLAGLYRCRVDVFLFTGEGATNPPGGRPRNRAPIYRETQAQAVGEGRHGRVRSVA